jgi:hypothetical protein
MLTENSEEWAAMECEVIGWCALKPEVQAAWVQAVGSVVAIIAALAVPNFPRRTEVSDRKAEAALVARSFGTVLHREFVRFGRRIDRDLRVAERAGPQTMVSIPSDTIPQGLWDDAERLHLLGPAGNHALLALNAVRLAREELYDGKLTPTEGKMDRFIQQMRIAAVECDEAITALDKILHT